ncbi:hypothetical protein ACKI10_06845 [Streptomyces galilaeus]|uniref:hypothetical protein n=1 Tax=Streptomyces galilaeus TaxID=33899 RepID=UPI0038F80157
MSDEPNVRIREHGPDCEHCKELRANGATCLACSGEGCAEHAESRRLVKARPVEITAVCDGLERKLTVPLWMFHSFSKLAREYDAQTPGVQYDHRYGRSWKPVSDAT